MSNLSDYKKAAQEMANTQPNQASEDELRRYHLSNCAKYETLRGIYPNDRRPTGDPCTCGIESLIRTEKLKLLAEVREEAFSGGLSFELDDGQIVIEVETDLKSITTKLEAEL